MKCKISPFLIDSAPMNLTSVQVLFCKMLCAHKAFCTITYDKIIGRCLTMLTIVKLALHFY